MIGNISIPIAVLTGAISADDIRLPGVGQHHETCELTRKGRPGDRDLDGRAPTGPIDERGTTSTVRREAGATPPTSRRFEVIVVGSGLAGASAAATLGELGYQVKVFTFHDSPRRAHSIAAQGGINAAKNYQNDGDSVYRLFYDTVKGGDFRAREANVYRLAQVSREHHRPVRRAGRAVRPRVRRPARQPLVRRRPGVAHVLRPRPDRPAAAARRVPGARCTRSQLGTVKLHTRTEMLDLVVKDGVACGIVARDLVTGEVSSLLGARGACSAPAATATSSTCRPTPRTRNVTAAWRAHQQGRAVRQPVLHADPPHVHPGERRVPVEAHADVGVAAQRRAHLGAEADRDDDRSPDQIPEDERDYFLERATRRSATSCPATSRRRNAKREVDAGRGVGPLQERRVPRLLRRDRPARRGRRSRSATGTSSRCTSASPTRTRTRCRCASTPPSTTRWAGCGSTTT